LVAQVETSDDTRIVGEEYHGPFGVVGGRIVDEYKIKGHKITAYFYDPQDSIAKQYPNFNVPDSIVKPAEKLRLWKSYFSDNPLFVFELRDKKDNVMRYYCLRGRPMDKRQEVLYKMESIKPEGIHCVDPFQPKTYAKNLNRSYNGIQISGYVPAMMRMFQQDQGGTPCVKGQKITFLGTMVEPTGYEQFKAAANFYIYGEFRIK